MNLLPLLWLALGAPLDDALADLARRLPACSPVACPAAGPLTLQPGQSLTVEQLRGVALDDDPPRLGQPAKPYPANLGDGFAPGTAPYVAREIRPFRLRRLHAEWCYGGWHTWAMSDYASAHGFDIVSAYNRRPAEVTHLPAGTRWMHWGGFVDWPKWLEAAGLEPGRYDQLADRDVASELAAQGTFARQDGFDSLMIDLEHSFLSPARLRQADFYPAAGPAEQREAFEAAYYAGYAKTYSGPLEAARAAGWRDRSVYGWQPFARTWHGLEKATVDPATDEAWNLYGRRLAEAVDLLNPSVYCFYWDPKNVAYTLANLDLNVRLNQSLPRPRPIRPYYWTLLHGGGGGWRWWAGQPLSDEETRAMTVLGFFCGTQGLVNWNWSGTGDHTRPSVKPAADLMLRDRLELAPVGGGPPTTFSRYDVIHVLSVTAELVRFQRVIPSEARSNYGIGEGRPVYELAPAALQPHLRPAAEPVAAMVEGLALVRAIEELLAAGRPVIDVPAQRQFAETLPIVRRIDLGAVQLLATWDPLWAQQPAGRAVELRDFAGRAGLHLTLPADGQVRLWLLRLP
ncbi:MAG: hypothetical protein IT204_13090 [Fimbriimonadaceae bacterium]|nr:hypothetical protein [Fimbriimonadaceae bacterium]